MKRFFSWGIPGLAAVVAVALLMQPTDAQPNILGDLLSSPESGASTPILIGSQDAPVTIEEYASLSCPHCAKFHNEVLPELMEPYIKTGKVNVVWYSYVRNEPDLKGTMLLNCIEGNDRKATFVKVLFDMQDRWAFEEDFVGALGGIARAGGVSQEEFDRCMADTELEIAALGARKVLSESGKVASTPTFYVAGEQVVGARPAQAFIKMIDDRLASRHPAVRFKEPEAQAPADAQRRPVNAQ